ncbi:MAG: HAD-IIA family hydrolase [Euryarchaeota archaeon]|nr:HAD-IIA family hydrolase [Euryarchaeota archaeon]
MHFKAFVLDLDGVVYRGRTLLPGVEEKIAKLRRRGRVLFVTNNSTKTRAEYAEKLSSLGVEVREDEIITSAYAAALYIAEHYPRAGVYVIGEAGLRKELEWRGISVRESDCGVVVVGLDRRFTYEKLAIAQNHLLRGAELLATNRDPTLVTERGPIPGAGSIVAAVERASGRRAKLVGKPSKIMGELILRHLGAEPQDALLIGDRLDTDIAMGKALGMRTALVLTGATKREEVERSRIKPDYVLDRL